MTLSRIEEVSILEMIDKTIHSAELLHYDCSNKKSDGTQSYPYLKGEILQKLTKLRDLIESPRK